MLRALGRAFGVLLFMTFVSAYILMMAVIHLTDHNTLEPLFIDMVSSQYMVDEKKLQQTHLALTMMCRNRESVEMPFGNDTILLDCVAITEIKAKDLGKVIATAMFEKLYYIEYECDFIDCLKSGQMFVIVSAKGNRTFRLAQNACLLGVALGAFMIFVSSKGWSERLKGFGVPLIIIGLPFVALSFLENWITATLLPELKIPALTEVVDITPLLSEIFSSIQTILLTVFVGGIALTVCGYVIGRREKRQTVQQPKKLKKSKAKMSKKKAKSA